MIHQKYLEQAYRIRKDYLSTDEQLIYLKDELEKINNNIKKSLDELIKIREKSSEYTSNEKFQADVMKYLKDFEDQAKKVEEIYKPLNDNMESLKKEEMELFSKLKDEYKHIKEDKIIEEVQEYIKEKIG
jgi:DNA-binding transcriptional regulator GbsR (MarR family)